MKILHVHDIPTTQCRVEVRLKELGYQVKSVEATSMSAVKHARFDLLVLDVPACRLKPWLHEANQHFVLPYFWWCEERKPATSAPHEKLDGILCCGMNDNELQWSILLGIKNAQRRLHLEREYLFLSQKLEERKTVDHAKIILSKINNVSETRAYEMMRKQAMNERKKLVDIAESVLQDSRLTANES